MAKAVIGGIEVTGTPYEIIEAIKQYGLEITSSSTPIPTYQQRKADNET